MNNRHRSSHGPANIFPGAGAAPEAEVEGLAEPVKEAAEKPKKAPKPKAEKPKKAPKAEKPKKPAAKKPAKS